MPHFQIIILDCPSDDNNLDNASVLLVFLFGHSAAFSSVYPFNESSLGLFLNSYKSDIHTETRKETTNSILEGNQSGFLPSNKLHYSTKESWMEWLSLLWIGQPENTFR